jgi:hypothetical protein
MNLLPYLILIAPFFIFVPQINNFAFTIGSQYTDVLITHFPNAIFIHNTIEKFSQIPLWSTLINSGYPFYADPLSGLYYLPGWVINLFPGAAAFNLMVYIHVFWGAVGIYQFLKEDGLNNYAALIGAMVFEFFPKLWAHYGAGHVTLLFGISWIPWLLLLEKKIQNVNGKKQRIYLMLSSLVYAQVILADVRMAAYGGLLWLGYSLSLRSKEWSTKKSLLRTNYWPFIKNLLSTSLGIFSRFTFSLLLSSPFLFPFINFVSVSTRKMMTAEDSFLFSLPPLKLISLFFPDIGSNAEGVIYPGSLVIVIFLVFLVNRDFVKKNRFWLLVSLLTIIFSFGSYLPFSSFWGGILSPSLLRVPTRVLFMSGISSAVVTGRGIQAIFRGECGIGDTKFEKILHFILFAFIWCITIAVLLQDGFSTTIKIEFLWGCVFLTLTGVISFAINQHYINITMARIVIIPIVLLDVAGISYLGIEFKKEDNSSGIINNLENQLIEGSVFFRTYSPSYSISQQDAAINSIEMADGINPMQIMSYAEYMGLASGVPYRKYSVTIPTFATGHPEYDNENSVPSATYLGRLNVKYIVSQFPLKNDDNFVLRNTIEGVFVYENLAFLPRIWIEEEYQSFQEAKGRFLEIQKLAPNEIAVRAEGPGRLIFSEISYPGWIVSVDSNVEKLELVDGLFRGVELAEGIHSVTLDFWPMDLFVGIGLNFLSLVVGVLYIQGIFHRRKKLIEHE